MTHAHRAAVEALPTTKNTFFLSASVTEGHPDEVCEGKRDPNGARERAGGNRR
jgi:hypothetical protein